MSIKIHSRLFLLPLVLAFAVVVGWQGADAGPLDDPFGRSAYELDEADWDLLKEAVRTVLEKQEVGATANWQSANGEKAGRATLLKTFTRNGMTCGQVQHEFTKGEGQSYQLPFCKMPDGRWKIAF
jgi:surface antigen